MINSCMTCITDDAHIIVRRADDCIPCCCNLSNSIEYLDAHCEGNVFLNNVCVVSALPNTMNNLSLALYTSPSGRPVYSNIILASWNKSGFEGTFGVCLSQNVVS